MPIGYTDNTLRCAVINSNYLLNRNNLNVTQNSQEYSTRPKATRSDLVEKQFRRETRHNDYIPDM